MKCCTAASTTWPTLVRIRKARMTTTPLMAAA
jgi:hypothetical protein